MELAGGGRFRMDNGGLSFLAGLKRPALVGVIHVGALPGTPRASQPVDAIAAAAAEEARVLEGGGVDAIIIENMHDLPYLRRRVGPEIVAGMTAISVRVRAATKLALGVQVLAGANRAAMAVALAADCQFIRAEGFVFAHVADEGLMADADAGKLLRYRKMIGAERIAIIVDVKKKHSSHAITADVDLAETAKAAAWFGADGVVVTGTATGEPTSPADVAAVQKAVGAKSGFERPVAVLVGSGVTPENVSEVALHADGLIVGSYLKRDGHWADAPDKDRVRNIAESVRHVQRGV